MPVIFCHNLAVKEFPLLWTKQQFQDICSWRERERDWKERHTVSKSWCQGPFTGKGIGQEVCTDACHGYRDQLPSWYWNSTTSICNTISPRKICNPHIRDIWDSAVCHVQSTQIGNAVIALIHHPSWSKTEEASKNSKHKNDTSVRNRNCRHSFEPSSVIKNHLIHTWRTGQFIAFLHGSRCEYSYPGGVMIPHLPQSQIQSTKLSQSRTYIHTYIADNLNPPRMCCDSCWRTISLRQKPLREANRKNKTKTKTKRI